MKLRTSCSWTSSYPQPSATVGLLRNHFRDRFGAADEQKKTGSCFLNRVNPMEFESCRLVDVQVDARMLSEELMWLPEELTWLQSCCRQLL